MFTVNLAPSEAHHFSASLMAGQSDEVASMGFLSVVAFAVTIMLASFALEFVLGLLSSALRLVRKAHSALAVTVVLGAMIAVGVAVVSATAT